MFSWKSCIAIVLLFAVVMAEEERGLKHKIPYGFLIFHTVFGIIAVLVIIKIVLAMSFVSMLSGLFHMFAGIKYLLKNTGNSHEVVHESAPEYYSAPEFYHSHEHITGFDGHEILDSPPHYKRQDIIGGRQLNHNINKRHIMAAYGETAKLNQLFR